MKKFKTPIILMLFFALTLTGCATTGKQAGCPGGSRGSCIALYTAGGILAGAIVGALTGGDRGKSAAIGAAAGGVAGFAYAYWGACLACYSTVNSTPLKDYAATSTEVRYSPQMGTTVKIDPYLLTPSAIAPGNTLNFLAKYYVMTASQDQKDITIVETRTLKRFDDKKQQYVQLGDPISENKIINLGTRRTDGNIDVPSDVEQGKYLISFMVTAEGKTDAIEMPFIVTRNSQILATAQEQDFKKRSELDSLLTTSPPTPAQQPIQLAAASVTGEKAVQTAKTNKMLLIIAEKVNLRESHNTKSKIITTGVKDDKFPLIKSAEEDGKTWYQIMLDDGRSAWIIGTAVKILGE
jgi:hypothetical protein